MDPPGPTNKKKEEEDEGKVVRFVTVTPATARRDSSVRIGKVGRRGGVWCSRSARCRA